MLIIYAHPNKTGHCGYVLQTIETELKNKQISYEILDLYAMNFNPVMKPEEHYTSGHREISSDCLEIQKKISASDKMIFIYPVWWQNMPAILKGFLDRIFTAHFAYKYVNNIPIGLLKGKKAIAIATTGGPMIYTMLIKCGRALKVLTRDTLEFCGIKSKGYLIPSARVLDDKKKKYIENKVKKALNNF